jgi:hypothetical protein
VPTSSLRLMPGHLASESNARSVWVWSIRKIGALSDREDLPVPFPKSSQFGGCSNLFSLRFRPVFLLQPFPRVCVRSAGILLVLVFLVICPSLGYYCTTLRFAAMSHGRHQSGLALSFFFKFPLLTWSNAHATNLLTSDNQNLAPRSIANSASHTKVTSHTPVLTRRAPPQVSSGHRNKHTSTGSSNTLRNGPTWVRVRLRSTTASRAALRGQKRWTSALMAESTVPPLVSGR